MGDDMGNPYHVRESHLKKAAGRSLFNVSIQSPQPKPKPPSQTVSFSSYSEIETFLSSQRNPLSLRNILGVHHHNDWIFNLNIGNVMHLSPMNLDELHSKLEITHELNRDAMLEKIVLVTVAYFCLGTEL